MEELNITFNIIQTKINSDISQNLSIAYSYLDNNIQTTNILSTVVDSVVDISVVDISNVIQNSTISKELSENKNIKKFFDNYFNIEPPKYIIDISNINFQFKEVDSYNIDVSNILMENILMEKYHEFLGDNSNNNYYKYVGGLNIKHKGANDDTSVNIKLYDITWDTYDLSAINLNTNIKTTTNMYTTNTIYTTTSFQDVSDEYTNITILDDSIITIKYIPYIITNDADISLNLLYEKSLTDNYLDINSSINSTLLEKYHEFLGDNSNNKYYNYVGGLNIKPHGPADASSVNIKLYDISWSNNWNDTDLSAITLYKKKWDDEKEKDVYTFTDVLNTDISVNVLDGSSIIINYIPYIITNDETDISLNWLYDNPIENNQLDISVDSTIYSIILNKYHEFLGDNSNNDYYKYVGGLNINHKGADDASSVNIKLYDITWDNYGLSDTYRYITDIQEELFLFQDISDTIKTYYLNNGIKIYEDKPKRIGVSHGDTITIKYIPYIITKDNDISLNMLYKESIKPIINNNVKKDILFSYKFDDDFVNDLYDKYEKYRDDHILNNSTIDSNFINKWIMIGISSEDISTNIRLFDTLFDRPFGISNRKTNSEIIKELFDNRILKTKNSNLSIKYNFEATYTGIDNLNHFINIPVLKNPKTHKLYERTNIPIVDTHPVSREATHRNIIRE